MRKAWLAQASVVLRLAVVFLTSLGAVFAVKLRIQKAECVTETITKPGSLVTAAIVASQFKGSPSYFDFQVRDPRGAEIYTKDEVDIAEVSFKNQLVGPHTFCFTVSAMNTNMGSGIASPRVGKRLREVSFDIQVGETWTHERVTTEHVDSLMEDISALKTRIQKLKSEAMYLKFREIRHRKTVQSTARRVLRYSLGKMVVIIVIAIAQPAIIAVFFRRQFKC